MNEMIRKEGINSISRLKNIDIKITLEQWPCAVATLGICVAYMFDAWINRPQGVSAQNHICVPYGND